MLRRLFALGLSLAAVPALGASEDAWRAFRDDVAAACADLAGPDARVEVNPFGSETYGAALIEAAGDRMVCVYDKATGAAELTAPFPPAR